MATTRQTRKDANPTLGSRKSEEDRIRICQGLLERRGIKLYMEGLEKARGMGRGYKPGYKASVHQGSRVEKNQSQMR